MVLKRKAAGSSSDRSPANQDDKLNITESQVVAAGGSPSKPQKRQRQKASVKPKEEIVWPEYFRSLFKIFKVGFEYLAFENEFIICV
ncbi:hypothetical protein B0H34DRAFT_308256 [Crassisporium funariophilum]|nr:hypothetical protein B0H34DRAFT_308256 [Crassisporium funariophilum]